MPLTLQTTTILAEFVGTKQRWSWYPAGVKIRHLTGNSSRQLDQFEARATRKIALRHSVSVGRLERPLRPVPATAPRMIVSISRMFESKTNRLLKQCTTPAQRYNSSHVLCLEPEIGSHGDVTSPLRYSI